VQYVSKIWLGRSQARNPQVDGQASILKVGLVRVVEQYTQKGDNLQKVQQSSLHILLSYLLANLIRSESSSSTEMDEVQ
jgi:hypothetical protein